jgi:hypothetical protein
MKRLHPVFNVIKLTLAPNDPIPGRHSDPPLLPELIDGEEHYEVESILNSRVFRRKLQYLVKWKGYGTEDNSWEDASAFQAQECISDFHRKNPGAPRRIRQIAFGSIPFRAVPVLTNASRRCSFEGGVIVRGTPFLTSDAPPIAPIPTPTVPNDSVLSITKTSLYVPPHRR